MINTILNKKKEIFLVFFLLCIVFWVYITLNGLCAHTPWRDESHAWNIAANLGIIDIFRLMKYEGHMFVWYLMLKPFTYFPSFYPNSMQYLNWICLFAAILIMWKKAPFNPLLKAAITFSTPFFQFYPIVARCYTVGILCLFIIAAMYKDRFKHPVIYSVMIFLAANTSIMALVGAAVLGGIFIFELLVKSIKSKNFTILIFPVLIALLTSIILYLQIGNCVKPEYVAEVPKEMYFSANNFLFSSYKNIIFSLAARFIYPLSFVLFLIYSWFNYKKSGIFAVTVFGILYYFFSNIYPCHDYNMYFIFVYYILAYWILEENSKSVEYSKFNKLGIILSILMTMSAVLFCFKNVVDRHCFVEPHLQMIHLMIYAYSDINNNVIFSPSMYDVVELAPYHPNTKFLHINGKNMFSLYNLEKFYHSSEKIDVNNLRSALKNQSGNSLFFMKKYLKNRSVKDFEDLKIDVIYENKDYYFGRIEMEK